MVSSSSRAEYVLDVIGAGATATCTTDWNKVWKVSPEAAMLDLEIERICQKGRSSRPVVSTKTHPEFASSWLQQLAALIQRGFVCIWRNPAFVYSNLVLCVAAGLVIGFTFFGTTNSLQGCQDKLFVRALAYRSKRDDLADVFGQSVFTILTICVPLTQQLQGKFIVNRTVYEVRERPARMYTWSAFLVSEILVEIPWNILATSMAFFCWYWTSGFDSSRVGFSYLLFCVVFPLYFITLGQAVATISPHTVIASMLFIALLSFVIVL